jgi:DNA repair exonuclease SbcCD ATPase subunit
MCEKVAIEISISNFRSLDGRTICLVTGKNYNFEGVSGAGKTTTLEAIDWCFYGKKTLIYPIGTDTNSKNKNSKLKTTVTITFHYKIPIIITRSTNPKILKVKCGKLDMESTVAQNYLIDKFGTRDFWQVTSYLRQKELNPLLSSSSSAKVELINQVAFSECNPGEYLEKVDEKISIITEKLNKVTKVFSDKLLVLKTQMKEYKICDKDMEDMNKIIDLTNETKRSIVKHNLDIEKIADIDNKIISYDSEIKSIKDDIKTVTENKLKYESYNSKLEGLNEELVQSELWNIKHQRLTLISRIKDNIEPKGPGEYTSQDELDEVKFDELKIKNFISEAESLQVPYIRSEINIEIEKIKVKIDIAEKNNLINEGHIIDKKLKTYVADLKELESEFFIHDTTTKQEISLKVENYKKEVISLKQNIIDIENEFTVNLNENNTKLDLARTYFSMFKSKVKDLLKRIEISKQIKHCPHCDKSIRMDTENNLVKADDIEKENENELEDLKIQTKSGEEAVTLLIKEIKRDEISHTEVIKIKTKEIEDITKKLMKTEKNFESKTKDLTNDVELKSKETQKIQKRKDDILLKIGTEILPDVEETPPLKELIVRLTRLESVKIPSNYPEYSYVELKLYNKYIDMCNLNKKLKEEIEALPKIDESKIVKENNRSIRAINFEIGEVKSSAKILEESVQKFDYLTQRLVKINRNKKQVVSNRNEMDLLPKEEIMIDLKEKEKSLVKLEKVNLLTTTRNNLFPIRDEKKKLSKELATVSKLKSIIIASEYKLYDSAINNINYHLNNAIKELFDISIKVRLSMFKTLKVSERIKPVVNLHILIDGMNYELKQLSGGEQERLSLALTLALMKISKSPIILLDEVLSSLDDDNRERAVEVLNQFGKSEDKVILSVNHGSTTGWYDGCVKF